MINKATQRTILRWIHLIFAIPILGYIYSPFEEIPNYAPAVRFVFVPAILFAGYWMYSGVLFAIIGVAVWLGAYRLSGVGAAILSQVASRYSSRGRLGWGFVRGGIESAMG